MSNSNLFSALFLLSLAFYVKVQSAIEIPAPRERLGGTANLSRDSFPEGFIFGTATSAYQVEGATGPEYGRGPSIWDAFAKTPGNIAGNATGDVAVDQYHRYKEDIDLMKGLNFDAYRFSISWSRIFPNGTGGVNWEGVNYYNKLIDYMLQKGITPFANLYHYDLPQALQEKYMGLLNRQFVQDFAGYADFCFNVFGGRVKNWTTFNEPRVIAALGFDTGVYPPNRCTANCTAGGNSGVEPYIAAHHLILAHAEAVRLYRTKYQALQGGAIGILCDFVWYEPLSHSKYDNYAARRARDFHIGWFLDPLVYGEYPKTMQENVGERLPNFTDSEVEMVKGSFDFLGINQYTSYYAYDQPPATVPSYTSDWNAGLTFYRHGEQIGPRSNSFWLYEVPAGMYKAITYVKERYGNPAMVVSENGMDDAGNVTLPGGLFDYGRIQYYKRYLRQLKKAIDKGANMRGYFAWSILDNFEWLLGYTSRFGIVYVDHTDNLRRHPKMSAYWFQRMLKRPPVADDVVYLFV